MEWLKLKTEEHCSVGIIEFPGGADDYRRRVIDNIRYVHPSQVAILLSLNRADEIPHKTSEIPKVPQEKSPKLIAQPSSKSWRGSILDSLLTFQSVLVEERKFQRFRTAYFHRSLGEVSKESSDIFTTES